jgi:hypothetical protein
MDRSDVPGLALMVLVIGVLVGTGMLLAGMMDAGAAVFIGSLIAFSLSMLFW